MSSTFKKSMSLWALFWAHRICASSSLRVLNWLFYSPSVSTGICLRLQPSPVGSHSFCGFCFPSLKIPCDLPLPVVQLDYSFRKLCNHGSKNPNHCWKSCPAHKPLPSLSWLEVSVLIWKLPCWSFPDCMEGQLDKCRGTGVEENHEHWYRIPCSLVLIPAASSSCNPCVP